jgi:AraC-like DNA-binding protein
MSTFRRAFIKKTGQTPSQFAAVKAWSLSITFGSWHI